MLGNIHINWYLIYECDTHLIGKFAQLKLAHTETESSGFPSAGSDADYGKGSIWLVIHETGKSPLRFWEWFM